MRYCHIIHINVKNLSAVRATVIALKLQILTGLMIKQRWTSLHLQAKWYIMLVETTSV